MADCDPVGGGVSTCGGSVPGGQTEADAAKQQETQKHWIGVKVVDDDGVRTKDVTVNCKLDDGTGFSVDLSTAALDKDESYKTKNLLDVANCDFSFPDLFNVEWWLQGGAAAKADSVTAAPAVGDGDCVLNVTENLKFRSYHSIWDQPENDMLKKDRPNPNMLAKGDVLNAPDKKDKVETKPVDQTWTFVVKSRKPFKLRLLLIDKDNKALSGKNWELKTPVSQRGQTGRDGLIEITGLKPGDKVATLEVAMKNATTPPKKNAPAPAGAGPPPYPPVVVAEDYKDKMPAPDFSAKVAKWDLSIGGLPPVKMKEGTLARLHNLGFDCEVDSDDIQAKRAVKAYQRFYLNDKNGSGKPADIQDDAAMRHDN